MSSRYATATRINPIPRIKRYKFNKYQNLYNGEIYYGLVTNGIQVPIEGVLYLEVTQDFSSVMKVRSDVVKIVGTVTKKY